MQWHCFYRRRDVTVQRHSRQQRAGLLNQQNVIKTQQAHAYSHFYSIITVLILQNSSPPACQLTFRTGTTLKKRVQCRYLREKIEWNDDSGSNRASVSTVAAAHARTLGHVFSTRSRGVYNRTRLQVLLLLLCFLESVYLLLSASPQWCWKNKLQELRQTLFKKLRSVWLRPTAWVRHTHARACAHTHTHTPGFYIR